MQSATPLLLLYVEAATKAVKDIGGASQFKKMPMFGSSERCAGEDKAAA